jgi:site-specific recombinase XerD
MFMQSQAPRLLDQVRARIRFKHYSIRTEQAYVDWIRRFIRFNRNRHPAELSSGDVEQFLTHLASVRRVAASTQNQAQSALLFLYREVLSRELPWLDGVVRSKTPSRLPVVLTRTEVVRVLAGMTGTHRVIGDLLYGTGMRIMEALRLRVKDVDFGRREILVRDGKGAKDRVTMLPERLFHALRKHLAEAEAGAPNGSRRGLWRGLHAFCAGPQISRSSSRMGVAVRIPRRAPLDRSAHRHDASSSHQ